MSADNYTDVILEDMNSKFDTIMEAVGQLKDEVKKTAKQEDLAEIKADIKTIKAAVTDTNKQVQDNEDRIQAIEAAA